MAYCEGGGTEGDSLENGTQTTKQLPLLGVEFLLSWGWEGNGLSGNSEKKDVADGEHVESD